MAVPAAAAAARVGWGEVWEPRGAAPRGRSAPPSFHALATPASCPAATGPCEGGTRGLGLRLLAPRGHLSPTGSTGSPAAERTGLGDLARRRGNGQVSGGAGKKRCAPAREELVSCGNRRTPFIESRSGGATLAARGERLPAPEHLPFALASRLPSRPVPSLAKEAPAGSYRPVSISPSLGPSRSAHPGAAFSANNWDEGVLSLPPSAAELAAHPSN